MDPISLGTTQKAIEIARLSQALSNLKAVKGQKGDRGPKGPRGERGARGMQGRRGMRGPKGERGNDGKTPVKGKDYLTPRDIRGITQPLYDEIAVLTQPERFKGYLEGLKGEDRLDASSIKGLESMRVSVDQVDGILDILPKNPPLHGGGSGATFLKSMRDVDIKSATQGQALVYNATLKKWLPGEVGGTPAGSDTQIQYNDSGSFGADSLFTWDSTNNHLGVNEAIIATPATDSLVISDSVPANLTGTTNTIVGLSASASSITSGRGNTLYGYNVGAGITDADFNVGIGGNVFQNSNPGDRNVGIGLNAMLQITGGNNVAVGETALGSLSNFSGDYNIGIGPNAGNLLAATGDNNIFIGRNATMDSASGTNRIAIGYNASADTDNQFVVGSTNANGSITSVELGVNSSDVDGMLQIIQNDAATFFGGVLTIEDDGLDVGINTTSPLSYFDVNSLTSDIFTDAGDPNNYSARFRRNSNTANAAVGIGFSCTTTTTNIGAAIAHERTGSNSVGDLIFYTRQSTTAGAAPEEVLRLTDTGNTVIGEQSALNTTATDGFLYVPTCAGAPTGTPTSITGKVALVFDTTNDDLYVYNGGWVNVSLT